MKEGLELLIPLTYIPGVALLIMSTSQRYINVNDIIRAFSPKECKIKADKYHRELRRAHLFRNSLIGLYLSVAFFSVGSLLAFLMDSWGIPESNAVLEIGTILGVGAIVFSVFNLVTESVLTLDILRRHHGPNGDDEV